MLRGKLTDRAIRLLAGRCVLATVVGLLAGGALIAGRTEVDQAGRAFSVASIRIHAGDTIDFVNKDDFDHQIYVDSSGFSFDSDETAPGEKVSLRIPVAGTFPVRCHIHPKMLLSVEVN